MLTELIELGWKMKKQMKDTQSEIKQNIQGTNSDRKETRSQSNDLEQKEEISNRNKMKKREVKKVKRVLWTSGDSLECSNIRIIGVPEGEEQQQEIKNLFEQIIKGKFPSLVKEIDF